LQLSAYSFLLTPISCGQEATRPANYRGNQFGSRLDALFFGLAHDIVGSISEDIRRDRNYGARIGDPESIGGLQMLTTKLNLVAPLAFAILGVIAVATEPALAGAPVPGPIIGAGLPALAILAGGYWLIRKVRQRR
jgi:hypothetical protein